MRRANYILGVIGLALLITSCTDSRLEKRVKSLEERVAKLESQDAGSITSLSSANVVSEELNPDGKYPKFVFENVEYNFGTVNEGDVVNHTFSFTNSGEAPLLIKNAVASCGCTVPSWPKEPIAPGETGKIEVSFNSSGKTNQQTKTITITANTDPSITKLTIKGMVTPKGS